MQNALPVWHTQSTVTGSATTLGLAEQARIQKAAQNGVRSEPRDDEDEDDLFEAHFANMDEDEDDAAPVAAVKEEDFVPPLADVPPSATESADVVMVMGTSFFMPTLGITD